MFGVNMSATHYEQIVRIIGKAARKREGGAVTFLAVHGLVTAAMEGKFRDQLNEFDAVCPDGQPVRWAMNLFDRTGLRDRVYGPETMRRACELAANEGIGIYLYGSTQEVIDALKANLIQQFPRLQVVGAEPSIFRPLTPAEDQELIERINSSGAGMLFVGLGCPRQEAFAFEHRKTIKAVQLAVGAAFDFHAGNKAMAPSWMQKRGLEWLFRLTQEPGRLWKRYLVTNSTFCLLCMRRMLVGH
jgi:exopolysaccharide biosynthesis WecB/TagA/CpsF family protein